MNIQLTEIEARVLGSLMEKQVTTPDQYPLSLNAAMLACNQKTNREPVLELTEVEVQAALDSLMKKYWVSDRSAGYGGRVTKYQQRFCNTEFGPMKLSAQEFALMCLLLLRGAQTPGELRSRAQRLAEFVDVAEVERALEVLMKREDGPFVVRLERRPGEREVRYRHVFFPAEAPSASQAPRAAQAVDAPAASDLQARVAALEEAVASLQEELVSLRRSQPS